MYEKSFFLEKELGNNALSFSQRTNKKLYVPALIPGLENQIELGDEIVFEDRDFSGNMLSCSGLKNFYEFEWKGKKIILFDNHNHAYFFWWRHIIHSQSKRKYTLIHIDEHSDMRDPGKYLDKAPTLQDVFEYTNYFLNVGNYIIPAIHDGIIEEEIIQIRDTVSLQNFSQLDLSGKRAILNLDLDIFDPALDFIDESLKKRVIHEAAKKSDFITVATSPFFIDQQRAIQYFKELFFE